MIGITSDENQKHQYQALDELAKSVAIEIYAECICGMTDEDLDTDYAEALLEHEPFIKFSRDGQTVYIG